VTDFDVSEADLAVLLERSLQRGAQLRRGREDRRHAIRVGRTLAVVALVTVLTSSVLTLALVGRSGKRSATSLTTQGGANLGLWSIQKSDPGIADLLGVSCTNASDCWAVGGPEATGSRGQGGVIATSNGGTTWSTQTLPPGVGSLLHISCVSSDCWAVGENPSNNQAVAVATSNAGETWTMQILPSGITELFGVTCVNTFDCWAVGNGRLSGNSFAGFILATTNGGLTWTTQARTRGFAVQGVSCVSASDCWAFGFRRSGASMTIAVIVATRDSGHVWAPQHVPSSIGGLLSLSCVSADCWAVGYTSSGQSFIVTNVGSTRKWTVQTIIQKDRSVLESISCESASDCWAVGSMQADRALILATDDGGSSWRQQRAPNTGPIFGIACPVNVARCWAVGAANEPRVGAAIISNT
jgi:photosystem II stability/assembly factor-like uncharacterized protein